MTVGRVDMTGDWMRLRTGGWLLSLCLHGVLLLSASLLVGQMRLAPSTAPFQWNVAVIAPASPTASTTSTVVATPTSTPRPTQPVRAGAPANRTSVATAPLPRATPDPPTAAPTTLPAPAPAYEDTPPPAQASAQALSSIEPPVTPLSRTSVTEEPPAPPTPHANLAAADSPTPTLPQDRPSETSLAASPSDALNPAPPQVAVVDPAATAAPARKPDYGWLAGLLLPKIDALKHYPAAARMDRLEGRVVLRVVVQEDGRISSVVVAKSSGHESLDQAAMDTMHRLSPVTLTRPLEQASVTLHVPIAYRLDR